MVADVYVEFINIYFIVSYLQAMCKPGLCCVMMARALLVHWLSSPYSERLYIIFCPGPLSVLLCKDREDCFTVWRMKQNKTTPFGEMKHVNTGVFNI